MKTTIVEIDGQRYELRKMLAATGGYIWQRIQVACLRAAEERDPNRKVQVETAQELADALNRPPEERMRGVCALAYMYLTFADYEFTLTAAMRATSRFNDAGMPMPIMAYDGRWAGGTEDLEENPALATRVMTESLAFNLHPYLAARSESPQKSPTA
jgi:hypothetical protein